MKRHDRTHLRVAMIGCRGVPARWGGVERHVEELGAELVARGHRVTVFCRRNYAAAERPRDYRGMRLAHLPTVGTKHLDAIVHSALATATAMARSFDIVHYHALGPGACALLPRYLSASKVVLTVHGLDDQRAKWGSAGRSALRAAGWLSARVPDATIVVSRDLQRHYRERHGRACVYVPNGTTPTVTAGAGSGAALARLGLRPGRYLLFVGRFVPEKAPDLLLRAFGRLEGDWRLVLAGDSSFTEDYVRALRLRAQADPRVVLAGFVYGADLAELYAGARAFVLPSLLEGMPLTLLEAAAHGTPVVASAIPPHLEVLGGDGPGHRLVAPGDEAALAGALRRALADPAGERAGAAALRRRVLTTYRWDAAAGAVEDVYRWALERPRSGTLPEPPAAVPARQDTSGVA
jgi:glycosyltransferase involved in cell wall biosynthesis